MGRQDFEPETLIPTGGFFDGAITQYGDKAAALTARHDSSPCADRGQNIVVHGTQDPCVSERAFCLGRNNGQENAVAFAQNSRDEVRLENGDGSRTGTVSSGGGKPGQGYPAVAVAFAENSRGEVGTDCYNGAITGDVAATMGTPGSSVNASGPTVMVPKLGVRRLTPTECERLQGFPDGHTLITYRGKPAADGPRYRAIGNSMAVPVMRWIGSRIGKIEKLGGQV